MQCVGQHWMVFECITEFVLKWKGDVSSIISVMLWYLANGVYVCAHVYVCVCVCVCARARARTFCMMFVFILSAYNKYVPTLLSPQKDLSLIFKPFYSKASLSLDRIFVIIPQCHLQVCVLVLFVHFVHL
jgi:hypothetical protein